MSIGEYIGILAEEKGINLHKLADLSGVSYNTIYSIVRRKSNRIGPKNLQKIAAALGVSTLDLLGPYEGPELPVSALKPHITIQVDTTPDPEWAALDEKIRSGTATPEERARYWELMNAALEKSKKTLSEQKQRVLGHMDNLSDEGQGKVVDYADDLVKSGKYPPK